MTIIFYKNTSDRNVVNKSLSNETVVTGTLRRNSTIVNPVILVDSRNFPSISNVLNNNYCYISEFGRYYYVVSVEVVRTNLYRFYLHVDVLMSFSSQFKNLNAIIARQENLYNLYLPDTKLITSMQRNIVVKKFPNQPVTGQGVDTKSIIAIIAGGE